MPSRVARAASARRVTTASSARTMRRSSVDEARARLERLALEARVQLGRLGLALQRPQVRARLALDVERAVEVVLRAVQLQLGAVAALAVLGEPGRLLDQRGAVDRLGVHDRLDAALADDRVHLLAEAGVGEHLEHVDQPAARAVQAVDALARAVDVARDRDLREVGVEAAVGVVDHDLDLGGAAALDAVAAGEDHVLHRLAADRERALLAERPQHRIGDVGLAAAVGADHHADARPELEARAVREGLEALQGERPQIHAYTFSIPLRPPLRASSASSAVRAASCSESFLERPLPDPSVRPSTSATVSNSRSCGGPSSDTTRYVDDVAAPREPLLQLALEVVQVRDRELDLRLERLGHRLGRALEPVLEEARADAGLDRLREHAVGRGQALHLVLVAGRRRSAHALGHAGRARDLHARAAAHRLRADLGQPPRRGAREAREQRA